MVTNNNNPEYLSFETRNGITYAIDRRITERQPDGTTAGRNDNHPRPCDGISLHHHRGKAAG